jgi:hypothetical protein
MRCQSKIIRTSNYGDEGPRGDERFVLTYPVTEETAKVICDLMNADPGRSDDDYFRVVHQDHQLQKFEP